MDESFSPILATTVTTRGRGPMGFLAMAGKTCSAVNPRKKRRRAAEKKPRRKE